MLGGTGGEDISDNSLSSKSSVKCFMIVHSQSVVQDNMHFSRCFQSLVSLAIHFFIIFLLDLVKWTLWNLLCTFTQMHHFLQHAAIRFLGHTIYYWSYKYNPGFLFPFTCKSKCPCWSRKPLCLGCSLSKELSLCLWVVTVAEVDRDTWP